VIVTDEQVAALRSYLEGEPEEYVPLHQNLIDTGDQRLRLRGLGVRFTQEPVDMGPVTTAVLDDTCGNLIQIAHQAG
jgi:hypothetical protein